jgi:hypothetical protein
LFIYQEAVEALERESLACVTVMELEVRRAEDEMDKEARQMEALWRNFEKDMARVSPS